MNTKSKDPFHRDVGEPRRPAVLACVFAALLSAVLVITVDPVDTPEPRVHMKDRRVGHLAVQRHRSAATPSHSEGRNSPVVR